MADVVIAIGSPSRPSRSEAIAEMAVRLLNMLPQNALRGKWVLPVATGATPAHFLSIHYSLVPVLVELGARKILGEVFALESQVTFSPAGGVEVAKAVEEQFIESLEEIARDR